MNKTITIDKNIFEIFYTKYKSMIIPVLVILTCVILFFVVIVPQIQDIITLKNENLQTAQKIQQLKATEAQLKTIDATDSSSELATATSALPPNKEFINILGAVSSAATDANVNLGAYTFAVGNLATESASLNKQLSLQMQLTIDGSAQGAKQFIQQLSKKLPLTEVTDIEMSSTNTQITALFFYQPFPNLQFNPASTINTLSEKDKNTLLQLSEWQAEQASAPTLAAPSPTAVLSGVSSSTISGSIQQPSGSPTIIPSPKLTP